MERAANKIKQIMTELKLTYTNESPKGFSYDKFQKFRAIKWTLAKQGGVGEAVLRTVTEKWTAVIAVTGNHLNMKLNDCSTVTEWPRIICGLHRPLEDTRPVNGLRLWLSRLNNEPACSECPCIGQTRSLNQGCTIYLFNQKCNYRTHM
jgi:hypothetical protein